MPPTFLAFAATLLYLVGVCAIVVVTVPMLAVSRTRPRAKRVLLATGFTVPGMLVGSVVAALAFLGIAACALLAAYLVPGESIKAVVTGVLAFGALATSFVCWASGIILGWRIGWRVSRGLSLWEAAGNGRVA
jgi:hypothetical protein